MEQKKAILVVEDEYYLRDFYTQKLSEKGYQVTSALNGDEALKKLVDGHFDLVLLDILMPVLNGIEVLKIMKADDKYKNIPVLMLTNLGQEELIKQGFQLGAQGYLIKTTLTIDQITEEIEELFRKQEAGQL